MSNENRCCLYFLQLYPIFIFGRLVGCLLSIWQLKQIRVISNHIIWTHSQLCSIHCDCWNLIQVYHKQTTNITNGFGFSAKLAYDTSEIAKRYIYTFHWHYATKIIFVESGLFIDFPPFDTLLLALFGFCIHSNQFQTPNIFLRQHFPIILLVQSFNNFSRCEKLDETK